MKNRWAYLETAVLAVTALALSVTAARSQHLELLNAIYPSSVWGTRCEILQRMMVIYGAGIAMVATASWTMIRYRRRTLSLHLYGWIRSCSQEAIATCRWFYTNGQTRQSAVWLLLIIAIGAAVRFFFLAQPMRFDEAYTFLNFVNRDLLCLFEYPLPNNHVLHTILVRISVGLFGSHPVAIRLPAVLAGLLAIPLTFFVARTLNRDDRSGYLASGLVAVFPYVILYDTMARGYSLLVLLTLCLVGGALRMAKHPSMPLCSLMALVIALGGLNMPSFLFPTAGVFCWICVILLQRGYKPVWVFAKVLTPCAIMAALLTGILYTPVVVVSNGIDTIINNRFVTSLPPQVFLAHLPDHVIATGNRFVRGVPIPVLIVCLALLVVGFYATARERRWTPFTLIPAVAIGGGIILLAKQAIPFDRTWIYCLPLIFLVIDAGAIYVARCPAVYLRTALLLLAGYSSVSIMNRDMISSFPDTGHFPEAPVLVGVLSESMNPEDQLRVLCPADSPALFYMWYMKVPGGCAASRGNTVGRMYFIVKPSSYSLEDMTQVRAQKVFAIGDAELFVAELGDRTETFDQPPAVNGLMTEHGESCRAGGRGGKEEPDSAVQ